MSRQDAQGMDLEDPPSIGPFTYKDTLERKAEEREGGDNRDGNLPNVSH